MNHAHGVTPRPQKAPAAALAKHLPVVADAAKDLLEGRTPQNLPPPRQVEMHLGPRCDCNCSHCCGTGQRTAVKPLPTNPIFRLIDEFPRQSVWRLEASGITGDPVTWSGLERALERCNKAGVSVGLHSKFINVSPGLINVLAQTQTGESCAAVSIDYFEDDAYQKHLRPVVENALECVRQNTERLCAAISEQGSTLEVSIRTLILNGVTAGGLRQGTDWVYGLRHDYPNCTVNWRMSSPWIPAGTSQHQQERLAKRIPIHGGQIEPIEDCIAEILRESEFWPGRGKVYRRAEPALSPGDCPVCFNQLLYGAIGADGGFYPCQGIASPKYSHLSYGNLHDGDDFFECWARRTVSELMIRPGIDCPGCAAPHEALVNRLVMDELNGD